MMSFMSDEMGGLPAFLLFENDIFFQNALNLLVKTARSLSGLNLLLRRKNRSIKLRRRDRIRNIDMLHELSDTEW